MTEKRVWERTRQHGMSKTREYETWCALRARCRNEGSREWPDYGGRGIKVCDRWEESFENFFADMGPRPSGMSIDRINNDGNYEPSNCRWATNKQQLRNTRRTRILTIDGVSRPMSEWAEVAGLKPVVLRDRLRLGWEGSNLLLPTLRRGQWSPTKHIGTCSRTRKSKK